MQQIVSELISSLLNTIKQKPSTKPSIRFEKSSGQTSCSTYPERPSIFLSKEAKASVPCKLRTQLRNPSHTRLRKSGSKSSYVAHHPLASKTGVDISLSMDAKKHLIEPSSCQQVSLSGGPSCQIQGSMVTTQARTDKTNVFIQFICY